MSLAGEAVVTIWHDITSEGREDYYAWHVHEHMPERVGIPGFIRGRRYVAERAELEFFHFYEAQTIETLGGLDYRSRLNDPTPWTVRVVKHFRNVHRATQRVRYSSGPGVGGNLLTVRLEAVNAEGFCDGMRRGVLATLAAMQGVCGAHLCESDQGISRTPTKEKEARGGETSVPGWTLMVEAVTPEILARAERDIVTADALRTAGAEDGAIFGTYRLEYVRTKTHAGA